jgi:hypothetical protein
MELRVSLPALAADARAMILVSVLVAASAKGLPFGKEAPVL